MTPTPRRSGPLVAIGMTIAFGAVLAYCGRVATPTLVARAAPDVAAATFDATVGEGPAGSIDPAAPSSDAAVTSPDPLDPLDPVVGTGAGALAATSAATAGASPGPDVTVATGAPRVQGSGSSTSSRPSAPTGSSAPSPGGGASPATAPATLPGVAGSVTTVAASSTSAVASAAAVPGVSSTAPTSTVAVTSTAPGATPTSTTSSSSTTTTTAPSSTTATTTTTTTTTTAPATTVAPTTTTTPAAVLPPPTTTPAPIAGGAVVDIDFQQGTDAASVGLEALSPGPHGVTTDLAIAGGVARARRLDVEVYARTTDLGSADHWVEADLHIGADIVGNYTGVMTRVSASDAGYAWHKLEVWGTWGGVRLLTLVGSRIADEQYFAFQLRPDTTYRLRLETRGSLISGYVDGRQLFEVTAPTVPWSPMAGINMTASGDPSHTTLDNLRAGRL